jgi:hypothetical protein
VLGFCEVALISCRRLVTARGELSGRAPFPRNLHLFGPPVRVVLTAVELLTPRNTIKFLPGFTCEARQGKAGDWGRSGNSAAPVGFEDSLVVEGRFRRDVLER